MKSLALLAGLTVAGITGFTSAGVVALTDTPAGNTYTFNPRSQGGSTAGQPVVGGGDTNATTAGLNFNVETAAQGNASYYLPTAGNSSGTLSYTFTSATPGENINTLTIFSGSAIFAGAGYPGTVSGTYTPLGGSPVQFYSVDGTNSSTNLFTTQSSGPLLIDAPSATITYTLTATSGNTLGVQLFRSSGDIGTPGDYTFSAAATFTPEPASMALMGLGGLLLLGRRRQVTH